VDVGTARRACGRRRRHDHAAEQVPEGGGALGVHARREIEAGKADGARRRGGYFAMVVAPAPFGIDQRLVGRQDVTEACGGFMVPGIDVGVVAPGQPLVGAADVLGGRAAPDAEHDVKVHGLGRTLRAAAQIIV
jgi:hypothetical protein